MQIKIEKHPRNILCITWYRKFMCKDQHIHCPRKKRNQEFGGTSSTEHILLLI